MQCYSIPNTVALITPDAFSHNEELRFINVPQFNRHIMENLPDLRTTSIYTVNAKKEGVTMKAAVTGELQDRMNELFDGEMVPIARFVRQEGAMPDDVVGNYLLQMWLCFHMGKYPLHKVCFCPSITVEKLNNSIFREGITGVKKIEKFNKTTALHMLAMNPHATETTYEILFNAWVDAIFKKNSLKDTPIDCARVHNFNGMLTLIKCLCLRHEAMTRRVMQTKKAITGNPNKH